MQRTCSVGGGCSAFLIAISYEPVIGILLIVPLLNLAITELCFIFCVVLCFLRAWLVLFFFRGVLFCLDMHSWSKVWKWKHTYGGQIFPLGHIQTLGKRMWDS